MPAQPLDAVPDEVYDFIERVALNLSPDRLGASDAGAEMQMEATLLFATIRKQSECGKPHPWRGLEYRCILPPFHDGKHRREDDGRFTDADVSKEW
jgi:hypothetical protein